MAHEDGDQSTNGVKAEETTEGVKTEETTPAEKPDRGLRFQLVFVSLCLMSLSTSLDSTIITTSLPTIVRKLGGQGEYVWVGNSFLLASTVVQPLTGQLADIFGRRWPMIISVALFILGSGIAGGAFNLPMLIAGRTVQGLGCGGIFVLLDIITCDMVPVRERGKYLGLVLSTGALGTTLGPVLGGALADTDWRWCFWITLITAGIALAAMLAFLNLEPGKGSHSAVKRIDWAGSALFIPSITAILLGLVMGGNNFLWGSYHIIVPLVLGFVGWGTFHVYQRSPWCSTPSVPPRLFSHRTSILGFILGFIGYILLMWFVIFLPIYFQGVLGTNALTAGVNMLPLSMFLIPAGIAAGGVMSKTGKFKPLHWTGFGVAAIGFGLLSILDTQSPKVMWAFFEIITSVGIGMLKTTILPAVQAALPESDQAAITALFSFLRSFGFVWGLVVPAIIFNNQFDAHSASLISDPEVRAMLSGGRAYASASGEFVQNLPNGVRDEVIATYIAALKTVWEAAIGFSLFGFVLVFAEKHISLRTELDTKYGLEQREGKKADPERAASHEHQAGESTLKEEGGSDAASEDKGSSDK